jgi:hypothetical protein
MNLIKRLYIIFLSVTLSAQLCFGQNSFTIGPNNAGTGANVTGIGTVAWTNPGNALSDDNSFATVTLTTGSTASNYLQTTDYGFSIPADATILGIQVTIGRYESQAGLGTNIRDIVVQLIKGGSLVGSNLAATGTNWPTSETAANYGGSSNLWGTTWTPSEINASDFGVALAVNTTNVPRTGYVDYMIITVTYSPAPRYFRSLTSGNWNSTSTWEESTDGGSWVSASRYPESNDFAITILNSHTVTVTSSITTDETTINAGGQVNINSGQTWTVANGSGTDLIVNGTVANSGTITTTGTVSFASGSTYQHALNGGTIPTAAWDANSNCNVTGIVATLPGGTTQNFGHLTWNCASQTAAGQLSDVITTQGNLTIISTGATGAFTFKNDKSNIVGGSYNQTSGTVNFGNNMAHSLTVTCDFSLTGGTFNNTGDNSPGGTLNIAGNFSNSATLACGNLLTIVFNGSAGNQSFTSTGTISGTSSLNVNKSSGVLNLNNNFNVISTLTLTSGNIVTGASTLTLGTSTASTGTLNYTSGSVVGNFMRWLSNTTGARLLPLSSGGNDRSANVNFIVAPTSGGTLTAFFTASDPGTAGLPLDDAGTSIVNAGIDGYWTITAGNGLTGGTYSLDLTANGFSGVNDYTTLRILKRTTGGSWTLDGTHSAGTGSNSAPVAHRTGMSGFSEFGIGGTSSNPLPVELSYFAAVIKDGSVVLKWRTETEVSNYGFDIERSEINPKSEIRNPQFEMIGFVQGHGNSNSPKDYSFIDENVTAGRYAYRLKQIDTDGRFEYSKVIEIEIGSPGAFKLSQNYPNPFNPVTTIRYSLPQPGNVRLIVYNLLGEKMEVLADEFKEAGVHTINFKAENLNSGMYIYKLEAEGFAQSRKMLLVK